MQIKIFKNIFYYMLILFVIYIYFKNAGIIAVYIKDALQLCYNTVIPSLFIFMVLATFLSGLKCTEFLSLPFIPLFRLLNIKNRKTITYCILSVLSGFAVGGFFLDKINRETNCNKNMLGVLSVIMSNNSPAFVITAVGTCMLGHTASGVMLYCAILISCFITAFLFSFIFPYTDNSCGENDPGCCDFIYAIKTSVISILNICGIVVFTYSLCKVILIYTDNTLISVALAALFEVTAACSMAVNTLGSNLYILCAILSFCPLSTIFQLKSAGSNNKISFKILWLSKLVHIPLSLLILRILINLFPQTFAVYASSDISVNMYWNAPHISAFMLILSMCFIICFDKKIGVFTILRK